MLNLDIALIKVIAGITLVSHYVMIFNTFIQCTF